MKRLLVGIALALIVAAPVSAAQAPVSGSISLATAEPAYQQPATFDWSVSGRHKGFYYPMIYVACYQGSLVYGELRRVDEYGVANFSGPTFVLGGGSSAWVSGGGGPADCTATLYLYPGLHDAPIIFLDQTTFSAAG